MNDFISGKPKATFIICKDSEITAETLSDKVKEKIPDNKDGEEFSLLYVYYYADKKFQYPSGQSNVLYIGHTKGENTNSGKSAGFRFKHLRNGADYKQNITLSKIYGNGDVIGLDIFEVADCITEEKSNRYKFLNTYGALPIADGAAYSKEKGALLVESLDVEVDELSNKKLQ